MITSLANARPVVVTVTPLTLPSTSVTLTVTLLLPVLVTSASSFPSYLNSSSDSTKTIYYVSSSYSDRATYRDDNGNYVEIIERDGNYYDSSSRERYY